MILVLKKSYTHITFTIFISFMLLCHVHIKAKTCSYSEPLSIILSSLGIKNCYTGVISIGIDAVLTNGREKN